MPLSLLKETNTIKERFVEAVTDFRSGDYWTEVNRIKSNSSSSEWIVRLQ